MPRFRIFFGLACAALLAEDSDVIRKPEWNQLPPPAQTLAVQLGMSATNFGETLSAIDRRTSERLHIGDWDQFIFYMLQSRSFTMAAPIEPARSAAQFIPATPQKIPADVRARMEAFLSALSAPSNERQRQFAAILAASNRRGEVETQYARAMEFLYEKEVRCGTRSSPQSCIAELYADRGLSSDTNVQAFRVVEAAVDWIRHDLPEAKLRRVLILGPGVDFSPRTGLREDAAPDAYQPGQVRHLLQPESVDCADINPLVIAYARKSCASTYQMNIATRFIDASPGWDLIIATNVLLYLDDRELLLAMNNIRHMLNPGGIFLHNDGRFAAELFGKACGFPVIRFGDITLDARRTPPLTDRYVLHGDVLHRQAQPKL